MVVVGIEVENQEVILVKMIMKSWYCPIIQFMGIPLLSLRHKIAIQQRFHPRRVVSTYVKFLIIYLHYGVTVAFSTSLHFLFRYFWILHFYYFFDFFILLCFYFLHLFSFFFYISLFQSPSTGYHTANIVTFNQAHSLLVWGGLHNRAATTRLEIFNLKEKSWASGILFFFFLARSSCFFSLSLCLSFSFSLSPLSISHSL